MDMAGLFFESQLPNLVRIHFSHCRNDEVFLNGLMGSDRIKYFGNFINLRNFRSFYSNCGACRACIGLKREKTDPDTDPDPDPDNSLQEARSFHLLRA